MAMGKRKRQAKQASMSVATHDLPRSAAHPFYARLNQILDQHDFDGVVEQLCARFYADEGRPSLPPGRYFRLLLIGYFEGLDAERAIAWRAADSFALRECLGWCCPNLRLITRRFPYVSVSAKPFRRLQHGVLVRLAFCARQHGKSSVLPCPSCGFRSADCSRRSC
jgi:hypothetical protein